MLKQTDIINFFVESKALLEGHFLLTSGLHSPNYFQCARVMQYPKYTELLCKDLASRFKQDEIDTVISPAIGGIVAGYEVAKVLGKRSIFAERENNIMTLRRGFEISEGEKIIIIEDVFTTGKSIKEVKKVVEEHGGIVVGVGVFVDRSSKENDFGCPLYSLMRMKVETYDKESCPLCKEGIELVKPGSRKIERK